jgi:hypothetical protein
VAETWSHRTVSMTLDRTQATTRAHGWTYGALTKAGLQTWPTPTLLVNAR